MSKNSIKILLLIIFTQIFCCAVFLTPVSVNAIEPYKFKIPIGDFKEITFEKEGTTKPIADYIQAIYKYAIGVVAILATVVMMIGGVVWITAGGNQNRVGEAKQYISGSLTGLVLVFCSYMILNTINPDLVKFKPVKIDSVDKIITGACRTPILSNNFNYTCESGTTEEDCLAKGNDYEWLKDKKCPIICCSWDLHAAATTLNAGGRLYENCDDSQTNLSKTDCKNKAGDLTFYQYTQDGSCNKVTLAGTISYQCVNE